MEDNSSFQQYNTTFNQYTFLEYLKELQNKFYKVIFNIIPVG
jgi:hypothetical protein